MMKYWERQLEIHKRNIILRSNHTKDNQQIILILCDHSAFQNFQVLNLMLLILEFGILVLVGQDTEDTRLGQKACMWQSISWTRLGPVSDAEYDKRLRNKGICRSNPGEPGLAMLLHTCFTYHHALRNILTELFPILG